MNKKVFSFDAETDGLWGNPFAIAAIVYEFIPEQDRGIDGLRPAHWVAVDRCIFRLPDTAVTNPWVVENIYPSLVGVDATHSNYEEMLRDFAEFYLRHKHGADVICHMGYPVEAHLLREMHRIGAIGDWDGPYPLYDISGNLQAAGEDPTSVDSYAKKHGLEIADYGTTHNPLYDCEVAARVYMHLLKKTRMTLL